MLGIFSPQHDDQKKTKSFMKEAAVQLIYFSLFPNASYGSSNLFRAASLSDNRTSQMSSEMFWIRSYLIKFRICYGEVIQKSECIPVRACSRRCVYLSMEHSSENVVRGFEFGKQSFSYVRWELCWLHVPCPVIGIAVLHFALCGFLVLSLINRASCGAL